MNNIQEKRSHNFKDITNQKFNMLTAIKYSHSEGNKPNEKRSFWLFKCDCGNEFVTGASNVKNGHAKSCGCIKHKLKNNNRCWKGYGEMGKTHWNHIERHAIGRGIDFNISMEDAWNLFLKQNRKCALTGLELNFLSRSKAYDATASLDRIDSSKAYTIDNIQWIHKDLNKMKWDFSQEHFIAMCKLVALKHQ